MAYRKEQKILKTDFRYLINKMQLVKPEQKAKLLRGEPYMAFVKVTPFYEEGNPYPKLCRYNELIPRKPKKDKEEEQQDLISTRREQEDL